MGEKKKKRKNTQKNPESVLRKREWYSVSCGAVHTHPFSFMKLMLKLIIFFSVSLIFSVSRDCKGFKILLAICPSSHRSEDCLPQQEVFWNLRLSFVSKFVFAVLVSSRLGFLPLPLHWVFFPFSFHRGSFCWVGFLLCSASTLRGRAWVVSVRLNPRNGMIDVGGVCNFPASVSLQQKFEATDGPVFQLSCIWQAKEKTRREARGSIFAPLFLCFFLLLLSLPYVNWAGQEGCLFYLRFSLRSFVF